MTQHENNQINLIEVLAILIMSVQTSLLEQDIEAQLRQARAEKDREREREAREKLHNAKPDPEKAKDYARSTLYRPTAEAVATEVDNVAPKLQHIAPAERNHAPEHLATAIRVSRGLLPEDDKRYAAARAFAQKRVTPQRVSLEQLAGTTSSRHEKYEYDGPDF